MDQLNLTSPNMSQLMEWDREFLDELREDNWLGKPEKSTELYIVDGGRQVRAEEVTRFDSRLNDLYVLAAFKDISTDRFVDQVNDSNMHSKLQSIHEEFDRGHWQIPAYVEAVYKAVPEDLNTDFRVAEAEVENLDRWVTVARDVWDLFEESDDYETESISLTGEGNEDVTNQAYTDLQESLSVDVDFLYKGDEEAIDRFNQLTSEYGDTTEYDAVPGTVFLGADSQPIIYIQDGPEIGIEYSEIESWMASELENTVANQAEVSRE